MPCERDEWLFETAEEGILEELCGKGYFGDGRPEDFYDPDSVDLVYDSLRRLPWPDPTAQPDLFHAAR